MIVFPGGVDVHTHVAGGALNFARGHDPGEPARSAAVRPHAGAAAPASAASTPTTFATGYLYAGMGWTTVNEAAVPILSAKHTHEELHDIRSSTSPACVLMANNEIVLDLLEAGEFERAQARRRLADLGGQGLRRQGGQPRRRRGLEVGQERRAGSHEPVEGYSQVTPAQIIASLARIVDELGLPHPLHLHCNNLGLPGQRRHHDRDDEGAGGATGRTWRTCSSTPTAATTGARCAPRRPRSPSTSTRTRT